MNPTQTTNKDPNEEQWSPTPTYIYRSRQFETTIPPCKVSKWALLSGRLSTAAARHSPDPSKYADWTARIAGRERQGYFDLLTPKYGSQCAMMVDHLNMWVSRGLYSWSLSFLESTKLGGTNQSPQLSFVVSSRTELSGWAPYTHTVNTLQTSASWLFPTRLFPLFVFQSPHIQPNPKRYQAPHPSNVERRKRDARKRATAGLV